MRAVLRTRVANFRPRDAQGDLEIKQKKKKHYFSRIIFILTLIALRIAKT